MLRTRNNSMPSVNIDYIARLGDFNIEIPQAVALYDSGNWGTIT